MKIVMTIVAQGAADVLDAHLAFHLNAGVDFIVAADATAQDGAEEILESYARAGHLRRADAAAHSDMARIGVSEHGADWLVPSGSDEFWWPRGESLKDVLSVVPPRYAVVQGLVREFAGPRGESGFFAETRTTRASFLEGGESAGEPLRRMLRPVYRATPDIVIDADDWTLGGRRVPLRAWYPIEVLYFPELEFGSVGAARLVDDTRLRDVLRHLRNEAKDGDAGSYALPAGGANRIAFPVPSIVDDAAYAVECAAVGEVDLVRLDRQIRDLELRIAALEAHFWPRVQATLRRLARRRR